jgi:predicted  nucleic acid-binding Zn-ribbon protein
MRQKLTLEEAVAINKQLRLKVKKLQARIREIEDGRADWKSKYMECKRAKEDLDTKLASIKKKMLQIEVL